MATRTPTIEVIIRDEVSAALERQRQKLRAADQRASFEKTRQELHGLEAAGERFKREIGTLLSMTGLTAFFSGGLVAGIVKATQSLGNLARESINTRYTAQALGLTLEQFDKLKVRAMALGQSEQQAQGMIVGVAEALRQLQVEGSKSSIFQELAKGKGGKELARELMLTINGPGGIVAAYQLLATRMQGMNANAQNSLVKLFGMGSAGFADLFNFKESELAKVVQQSEPETRKYALSMANLNITFENLKKTLAIAVMPAMADAVNAFDKMLRGPGGEVIKQFGTWLSSLKIDWNAIAKGVSTILDSLTKFLGAVRKAMDDLKPTIDAMGGWPAIFKTLGIMLGAGMLGGWIGRVTRGFGFIARQAPVIAGLTAFAIAMTAASTAGAFTGPLKGDMPGGAAGVKGQPGTPSGPAAPRPGGGSTPASPQPAPAPAPAPAPGGAAPYGRDRRGRAYPAPGGATTGYQPGVDDQEELRESVKKARVQVAALGNYLSSLGLTTDDSGAGPLAGLTGAISPGGGGGGGGAPRQRAPGGGGGGDGGRSSPTGPQSVSQGETPAHFANVRHNNPGAMYPGQAARQFGTTGTSIIGGGHKIATFPTPVHGAAANMRNLELFYGGMTIAQAMKQWSGGSRSVPGPGGQPWPPNMKITPELLRDPNFMIPFFQALARGESKGRFPMDQAQWEQAFRWYTAGGQPKDEEALKRIDPVTGQPLAPGRQPSSPAPPAPAGTPQSTEPIDTTGAYPSPITGTLWQGLGAGRKGHTHAGQDIGAATGTPIYSMGPGTVLPGTGFQGGITGGIVKIKYDNGITAKYMHLSNWSMLRVGQRVDKAGLVVGLSGATGARGISPHLHVEYYDAQGRRLDPKKVHGWTPTAREAVSGRQVVAGQPGEYVPGQGPAPGVTPNKEAERVAKQQEWLEQWRKAKELEEANKPFSERNRMKLRINLRGPRGVRASATSDGAVGSPTINREMDPTGGRSDFASPA